MSKGVRIRITLILFLTAVVVVVGVWNLVDRLKWSDPTDGFLWRQTARGLEAVLLLEDSQAPSGIQVGDVLVSVGGRKISSERDYVEALYGLGIGGRTEYELLRGIEGFRVVAPVIVAAKPIFTTTDFYRAFLAFTYLVIGVILGLRHYRSRGAQHFFVVCLLSFILYLFTYTNRLSIRDLVVYWGSAGALLLLPPIFLHFCLHFPERRTWVKLRPARTHLLYVPFFVLLVGQILWSTGRLAGLGLPLNLKINEWIDRVHIAYFALYFLAGAVVLGQSFMAETDRERKQQLKWISLGAAAGILPFLTFYVIPFVLGFVPTVFQEASSLSLSLIPLSFAYAVVRYKLMDVDIIFKSGLRYSLAVALTVALYFLLVILGHRLFVRLLPDGAAVATGAAALVIAFLFAPISRKIQALLDRAFYRERFDYRESLLEFSRALTTEISLERLANRIIERIHRLFDLKGAALLTEIPGNPYHFEVLQAEGFPSLTPGRSFHLIPPASTLPLGSPRESSAEPLGGIDLLAKEGIRLLQPFSARGRVVGLLALGEQRGQNFFTSEDFKLLQVLSGYAAIALDNAGLYYSLEREATLLQQMRSFNERIIESIYVAVIALDLEGRVTACNGVFEKLYGIPRSEVLGRAIRDVLPADVLEAIHRSTGTSDWIVPRGAALYRHYLDTRAGRQILVNLTVVPLRDHRETLTGSLLIIDDVSEKKRLEDQLLQAEKLSSIGLLAAGVAHEVNTPIAGISSYTQMLIKEVGIEDPRHQLLEKIERQTFRASEIVNNLLNFARLNETENRQLDINQLVLDSVSLLEHQLRSSQIEVHTDLCEGLPTTTGNSGKLQQVLVNLMLNARDAMPSGGRLEIRTQRNGGHILIDITDTGVGMTEEVLNHIYDPFFTTKETGRGTGLGLAVSYGIIQEHAGRIFVESKPGAGTHFCLKLPVTCIN